MVHIYLPQKIHQQLEAYEQRTGKTHADVVLDAVEATYATLLVPGDEPPLPKPHHVAFVLPMDQLDAAIEALTAGGAQLNPVTVTPAGDKLLFFFDPAGNYMQIVCRVNAMEP